MTLAGGNMMDVKRTNRSAVLRALHRYGSLSRKRLAELLQLTPAAITKITGELLAESLVEEGNIVSSSSAGRKEILLQIRTDRFCSLGVLINLRQAVLSAVRLDGSLLFSEEIAIPSRANADETTAVLAGRLLALARRHQIPDDEIVGLGLAVRGVLTADGRGVADSFAALDREDYPICDRMEALTGYPAVLNNNVRALKAVVYLVDPSRIVLYGRMFDHPYLLSRLLGEMQQGVAAGHVVKIEKCSRNHQLDHYAAPLLSVTACFENGGM